MSNTNLAFVALAVSGKIDIADSSDTPTQSNDLTIDVQGYFLHTSAHRQQFGTAPTIHGQVAATPSTTRSTRTRTTSSRPPTTHARCQQLVHGESQRHRNLRLHGAEPTPSSLAPTSELHDQLRTSRAAVGAHPTVVRGRAAASPGSGPLSIVAVARQLKACSDGSEAEWPAAFVQREHRQVRRRWQDVDEPVGRDERGRCRSEVEERNHTYQSMFPGRASQRRSSSNTAREIAVLWMAATSTSTPYRPTDTPMTAITCTSLASR